MKSAISISIPLPVCYQAAAQVYLDVRPAGRAGVIKPNNVSSAAEFV
jgi:hypothetical protein